MNVRHWRTGALVAALLMLLLPGLAIQAQGGGNLLGNSGFEGVYESYSYGATTDDVVQEFRIAAGWSPWYRSQGAGDPGWRYRRPEYRPGSYSYNGTMAQQFFASWGTLEAGLFQRVETAIPGELYRFSIAGYLWSSVADDPFVSVDPGVAYIRVGIDSTGGTNPYAETVVWSPFYQFYDEWRTLYVDAAAESNALTVFVWAYQNYPVEHNDVAVDNAYLGLLAEAPPLPDDVVTAEEAAPEGAPVGDAVSAAAPTAMPEADAAEEAAPAAPTAPALDGITFTPETNLRLRDQPRGTVLDVVPAGVTVAVVGRSDNMDWVLVDYEGQRGWIAAWLGQASIRFEDVPVVPLP